MILWPYVNRSRLAAPFLTSILFIACMYFSGCSVPENTAPKKFTIGVSQCTGDSNWRKATLAGIQKELIFHPGSNVLYENAEDNSQLQIKQIKALLNQNIDILLVSPNEAEPLTSVVEEVYKTGIPVVVIDRRIASDKYTAFVGADNFGIGRMAGNYVYNLYKPNRQIIEIVGLKGSTPTEERMRGFNVGLMDIATKSKRVHLYGNWLLNGAHDELWKIKGQLKPDDIIFAQNDPMALGAYEVYKKLGMEKTTSFIGVDALAGKGGGIELVINKKLQATLLNPTGGEEALQLAFKILNGEFFEKENTMSTVVIDSTNVRIMKLQTDKINTQQTDIARQQGVLHKLQKMYESQTALVNVVVAVLLLVITLSVISAYALWKNKKNARGLAKQNEEILYQKNQLVEMTAKAKEATDAKFNFFTNISHEFRTPLTLILGPVEDTLASPKLHHTLRANQQLVHKNTMRLLRLINQLMDYRKIEEKKMQLRVSENDIIHFVHEITDAFHILAKKKQISFTVNSILKSLPVWYDINMLDKVLFNLLSNAFKFTSSHEGVIKVSIAQQNEFATIEVEDNGIGMLPEEVKHVFEVFYQGNGDQTLGTGIGLALSKELVDLHQGKIEVSSEKTKGTKFKVFLPLGNSHFKKSDLHQQLPTLSLTYDDVKIFTTELEAILPQPLTEPAEQKEYSILIIEDNDDLRFFLKSKLSIYYHVYEAEDGNSGVDLAFENVPDLIISDIILPIKDGLKITAQLKQDIRTSHIPIILLTAKNSMEEQIKGIRMQADAFIVKPFNVEFLIENIRTLIKNRSLLRQHYTTELPSDARQQSSKKIDRKFLNEFTAIVEQNISNENFTVEDICREIGISRVQLNRKVKALLQYNVNDYVVSVRLQKAKYLLTSDEGSIFDIATSVGFSSQAYFSTVFKNKFGMTPTDYREGKIKV